MRVCTGQVPYAGSVNTDHIAVLSQWYMTSSEHQAQISQKLSPFLLQICRSGNRFCGRPWNETLWSARLGSCLRPLNLYNMPSLSPLLVIAALSARSEEIARCPFPYTISFHGIPRCDSHLLPFARPVEFLAD